MKTFNKLLALAVVLIAAIFITANVVLSTQKPQSSGRPYLVEVTRIARIIEENGEPDMSRYQYVTAVTKEGSEDFYTSGSEYVIREINGELYRFDYSETRDNSTTVLTVNLILAVMSALLIGVLVYVQVKILKPFDRLRDLPYELSKGNLTAPVKESKSRFFGRFLWGVDLLRESMEEQKRRELDLHREKKTMLLSLSHDIKTPLSAIKLYSGALSKGLYQDKDKQREIAESINAKADEIESYVSQIINTAREDFMTFDVENSEFYLSRLTADISAYYTEKLSLQKIRFTVGKYSDCLLKGDLTRAVEVMQNIVENAIKYGDGSFIDISFRVEEDCQLVTVTNGGCTLPDQEIAHIFESFWRGSNTGSSPGSGLGLYICRRLMNAMGGEIFAEKSGSDISVTAVFPRA